MATRPFMNAPAERGFPLGGRKIRIAENLALRTGPMDRADGPARLGLCFHYAGIPTVQKCSQLEKDWPSV
jgi:hypothetical protein